MRLQRPYTAEDPAVHAAGLMDCIVESWEKIASYDQTRADTP